MAADGPGTCGMAKQALSIHSSRKGRPGICACCPVWFVDNGDGQTLLELAFSTSNVPEAAMEVDMGQ